MGSGTTFGVFPAAVAVSLLGGVLVCASRAAGAVVDLQEGYANALLPSGYAGTQDTWISRNVPVSNGGARPWMNVGSANLTDIVQRSLIRFDVSSLAGKYSSINSVTLRLTTNLLPNGSPTVELYSIAGANAGWVEGAGIDLNDGFNADDVGATTWRYKVQGSSASSGTAWAGGPANGTGTGIAGGLTSGGVDYLDADGNSGNGITPLATRSIPSITSPGTTFDFTVTGTAATNLIDSWLDGSNEGLLLKGSTELDTVLARAFFATREMTDDVGTVGVDEATWRPILQVSYNVPEPATAMLATAGSVLALSRRRFRVR